MPVQTAILKDGVYQLAVEFEWQDDCDGRCCEIQDIHGAWPARLPKVLRVKDYDISAFFNEGELEAKLDQHFEQQRDSWRRAA